MLQSQRTDYTANLIVVVVAIADRKHSPKMRYLSTREIIRFEIGAFLYSFRDHLMDITKNGTMGNLASRHVLAFSAHDSIVSYLLGALGHTVVNVPYSAAVIFELWGPEPPAPVSEFVLRLRLKHGWTDDQAKFISIPGCSGKEPTQGCPLNVTLSHLDQLMMDPNDFHRECTVNRYRTLIGSRPTCGGSSPADVIINKQIAIVCVLVIAVIVSVVLMARYVRCRRVV